MRRILQGAIVVLALLALGLSVSYWLRNQGDGRGITRDNAALIREGMTEAEVRIILGCDPGDYRKTYHSGFDTVVGLTRSDTYQRRWRNDEIYVFVVFQKDAREVLHVHVETAGPPSTRHPGLDLLGGEPTGARPADKITP